MAELATGYCKYCGSPVMIRAKAGQSQEEMDKTATDKCTCAPADLARKRRRQRDKCKDDINKICGDTYPAAAAVLEDAIEPIQSGILSGASVMTTDGIRIGIKLSKDGIKTSLEFKKKTERLA